jgi:hypothetical protein
MGTLLTDADEAVHEAGHASNWNESRYVDFFDAAQRMGGWFRLGNRPNEGRAEVSACIYLPNGHVAFMFSRPPIIGNGLGAGGLEWEVIEPWSTTRVTYSGEVLVLEDPWTLTDPKEAFTRSPRAWCRVDLTCQTQGLGAVMGADQDHIERIFLPGQADFHYQHLARSFGTVHVGDRTWTVDGRGGKDHSWGPRNWHAKTYMRWLIAAVDDDHGFMLMRAVGPTKQTRSGFVWDEGSFHLVDDFGMRNTYAGASHYELTAVEVTARSGPRSWSAAGTPRSWVPLRHRQPVAAGEVATLRIVKSPAEWRFGDGRTGVGMLEYHDLLNGGRPVALAD